MQLVPQRYEPHILTSKHKFSLSNGARVYFARFSDLSLSRTKVDGRASHIIAWPRRLTCGCWGQRWEVRVHPLHSHWWRWVKAAALIRWVSVWVLIRQLSSTEASGFLLESGFSFQTLDFSNTAPRLTEEQARGAEGLFPLAQVDVSKPSHFGPQPPPQLAQFTSKISTLEEKLIPRRSAFNYQ